MAPECQREKEREEDAGWLGHDSWPVAHAGRGEGEGGGVLGRERSGPRGWKLARGEEEVCAGLGGWGGPSTRIERGAGFPFSLFFFSKTLSKIIFKSF